MKKNKKYSKKHIIIGVMALIILLFLAGGIYYLKDWKTKVRVQLDEAIQASTNGLYNLDYSDLKVNILRGNLTMQNISLVSDEEQYQLQIDQKTASDNRFHVQSKQLEILGVNLWHILVTKKLSISEIRIADARVEVLQEPHQHNAAKEHSSTDLYSKVKDTFKAIELGRLQIEPLHIQLSSIRDTDTSTTAVDSIRIQIDDFLLNAQSSKDSTRLYYCDAIEINVPQFTYDIDDSPYKVQVEKAAIHTKKQQVSMVKASLLPRISKSQYFQNDKSNKALITLELDSLQLEEFDLRKFGKRQLLHAKHAYIKSGTALFEKDKRYQEDNVNKIGEAPHQQIMKLGQLLRVDTLHVQNVDIAYQEYSKKYDRIGRIHFDNAHGHITNLSNDTLHLNQNRFMRADLRAHLMGTGSLHAVFGFDMLSADGHHSYKGSLGKMQAAHFNKITAPLLALSFESGNIQHIHFDIQANDYKHWGELRFKYNDFKINILDKPASNDTSTKTVLSFLVNQLILQNSNPDREGNFRIAQIDHERVPVYSHFKSIWKALFEGIQQSVGLSKPGEVTEENNPPEDKEKKNILERTSDFFKNIFKGKEDSTAND